MQLRPPLVLTGPPAVGKSATGRTLALARPRCALIEVDDVRQLVVSGAVAPWDGTEGASQQRLGVLNACALANNFTHGGIEVVVTDVLTADTAELYRVALPGCLIVRLTTSLTEALRRAATRQVWLSDREFRALYDADRTDPPPADHTLDVTSLDLAAQADAVERVWAQTDPQDHTAVP